MNLATVYTKNNKEEAIKLYLESKEISEKAYMTDFKISDDDYCYILNNLGSLYYVTKQIDKSIEIQEKYLYKLEKLYKKHPKIWIEQYFTASNILKQLKAEKSNPKSLNKKPQRNELCPCGSNKKYKKCCGKN